MSYSALPEDTYQTKPNSTMALVSLLAGIGGLTILPTVGSIIALITGYMARKEIHESAGALGGDGLATAGLILGWIGVGLMLFGLCVACVAFALCVVFALFPFGILYGNETFLPGLFSLIL